MSLPHIDTQAKARVSPRSNFYEKSQRPSFLFARRVPAEHAARKARLRTQQQGCGGGSATPTGYVRRGDAGGVGARYCWRSGVTDLCGWRERLPPLAGIVAIGPNHL
jgi:hypothetical protein